MGSTSLGGKRWHRQGRKLGDPCRGPYKIWGSRRFTNPFLFWLGPISALARAPRSPLFGSGCLAGGGTIWHLYCTQSPRCWGRLIALPAPVGRQPPMTSPRSRSGVGSLSWAHPGIRLAFKICGSWGSFPPFPAPHPKHHPLRPTSD